MSTSTITMAQGDTLPALSATLSDASGAVDLTGCIVTFRMSGATGVIIAAGACSLVDAVNGKVAYPWQAADTASAGTFVGQFKVIQPSGATWHFPNGTELGIVIQPTV